MERLKIGIIGAGRIGSLHAKNITTEIPEGEVVAIADIFEDAAKRVAGELGIPNAYKDYRYILDDKDIDAVFICTSTDTHAKLIKEASDAKKDIFCEKPIALNLEEIDEALSRVKENNVILQIGFNRRFDPSFARVRELVREGSIGEPHILKITSRDPLPPPIEYVKVSGGIFIDMTIHDFDMARFLIGDEIEEVFAQGSVLVDPEIGKAGDIDTAITTLKFKNGALGVIDNSRKAVYGYDQRVEVFGSKGVARAENKRPDETIYGNEKGFHTSLPLFFFLERYREAYIKEVKAFIESVREKKTPPVTGEDGKIAVVIAKAATRSLKEGKPVKL